MNLVLYQHHILYATLLCDSRTKPILTHTPEDPFLEIDVKGGEREHQSLSFRKRSLRGREILKGRERSPGGENTQVESISQGSQMLGVQEERCHMSS